LAGEDHLRDMKAGWIAVALVLGVSIGVWISQERKEPTQPETPATGADAGAVQQAPQTPPADAGSKFGHTKLRPGAASQPGAASPPAIASATSEEPEYTGYHQAIDVGPVFRRHFEQDAASGTENSMAMAHRELEREVRDDAWAYTIEAEIESSLIAETSLGNFRREHVECRATLCEIRISGEGDQQETAMQNWNESLGGKTWASRVNLNYSATVSENGQINALMIFRKSTAPATH
jgi:hypothetical protein